MTDVANNNKNSEQKNPVFVALKALLSLLKRGIKHLNEFIKTEGLLYFIACITTLAMGLMIVVVGSAMIAILIDIG